MPHPTPREERFSAQSAARTLRSVCDRVGLDARGARLVRLGENAIYRLSGAPVVVRIARSTEHLAKVRTELRVACWLAELRYPAARLAEDLEQIIVDGRVVSFWREIPDSGHAPSLDDLAALLRKLHDLPDPPFVLPEFCPLRDVPERLERVDGVTDRDRSFFQARYLELGQRYAELDFSSPSGVIRGDAHRGNLLTDGAEAVLLDFDLVSIGLREWDRVPTAMSVERFRLPRQEYQSFVTTYGRDVTTWHGYPVLRGIRELTMTTWLMQNIGEDPRIAREFDLRVASLRKGDLDRVWHVF